MKRKFDFTTGWYNNLISRLAVLVVTAFALCAAVAQADIVMTLNKIRTEQDVYTNVSNASSVKYAINYGTVGVDGPIDGITFVNRLGNGAAGYYSVYSYTDADDNKINYGYNTPQQSWNAHSANGTATAASTYTGSGITELDKLLSSILYNSSQPANSTTLYSFGNLEAGKTYTARILTRSWNTSTTNRLHTFTIDTNADGVPEEFYSNVTSSNVASQVVSEDDPFSYAGESGYGGAYAVDFTFTAQSNTAMINLMSGDTSNLGWHNYGVMLIENNAEQVKPTTPTLYNGSFEVDNHVIVSHPAQHGYLTDSNSGMISGWQFTNLTNDAMRAGLAWVGCPCQDFLGNHTPPDGRQLAWVQSGDSVDSRLYQNVYGFDPTDKNTVYRVSMDLGGRTATDNPRVSLFIGPDQATEDVYINAKEVTKGQFKEYSAVFVPNSDVQTIAIRNLTTTDTSLLVDNVQLKAYSMTNFFSDNYQVNANALGAAGISGPSSNDKPGRFGGLLGALSYTAKVGAAEQIQVGSQDSFLTHGTCENALFFATKNGRTESHASPNYNFANVGAMTAVDEGGRMYDISFKVAPQFDDTNVTNWSAVLFGLSQSVQTANVNGGNGVGVLFRQNGGVQIFDGTNGNAATTLDPGTFSVNEDGFADVRLVYFVPDFDGTSPVDVSLYINDKLIKSFQTGKGFADNFIQFEGYSGGNDYARSLVTDVSVKSSAELNYDVSRIKDMNRAWSPNGLDKLDVFFTSPRGEETTATHTGALDIGVDTQFDVAEGYTLDHAGATTGSGNINKVGKGTLRLSGNASEYTGAIQINEGSVDLGFNESTTLTNSISGEGNVIMSGKGKTTLTNATYEGSTTVNSGILSAEILSTDSITIKGGALEVGFLSASPSVTIGDGNFIVGNTSDSITMTVGQLVLTEGGTISFDFNDSADPYDSDWLKVSTLSMEKGFINLTFNKGDELNWWNNAGTDGFEIIAIDRWLDNLSDMTVTVDGVESPSWTLDWDSTGVYLMATNVAPTGSKYYLANLDSDLGLDKWTIDGTSKLGAKLLAGDNLDVTYSKPVILDADGTLEVASNYNLTLSGGITGNKTLEKTGYGILTLAAANNDFTGATIVSTGTLALTAENAIASSVSVTNSSAITMGAAQTLNNLTGSGTIDNGGYALTLNNTDSTEFSGVISGAGALVKNGNATLTLSAANTYTGGTTINAGTLKVVGAGTLGSAPVTNNAILEYAVGEGESMSVGYTIANNSSAKTVKTGAGNLSLTSTTTGAVEIQEGTITLANSLGNTGRRFNQLTIAQGATLIGAAKDSIGHNDGGTSRFNVYGTFDTTVDNETFINVDLHMYGGTAKASSGSTFDMYNNNTKIYSHALDGATADSPTVSTISASLLVRNNVTLDITTDANSQLNVSNVIQSENANGKVVKYGDGTLYLTAVNTFQGGFDIKEGRVISSGPNSSPSNLGTGPITIASGATLDLREANQFGYGAGSPPDITIRGTLIPANYTHIKNVTLESGLIEKENGYSDAGTGLDFATRTGVITSTGNSVVKSRFNINAGATATFDVKSDTLTVDGVIKSDGGFTKTGAGTMKLTAANTYSGNTVVSGGTLFLTNSGSLASPNVTVNTDGTFQTGANINLTNVVLDGGSFVIGETAASAAITTASLTLTSGTVYFDMNGYTASANDYDKLLATSATLTSGVINLTFNNGDETSWWNNAPEAGYVLMETSGLTADLTNVQVNVGSAATTSWYLATTDNNLVLKKLDGPEPPDPPTPTSEYYNVNSADISAAKWTIDGTNKKGVKFLEGDQNTATFANPVEIIDDGTFEIGANRNLTVAGVISGEGDVTKLGAGTLTLSGDNTYTGDTIVSAGTLNLTKTGQKGTLATGSTLTVDGATSVVTGHGDIFGYTTGTVGTINLTNGGTLHNDSTGNHITVGAAINMNNGVISAGNGTGSATFGNYVFDNAVNVLGGTDNVINANRITLRQAPGTPGNAGGKFNVANGAKLTISSQIFDPDGNFVPLVKQGAGTLVLSGDNTYTKGTTVSEGILQLTGDAVKANSSITIADNATLEYNVPTGEKSLDFTTSNTTVSGGNVAKTGAGKLKIKADGTQFSANNFTVSAGELDFKGQYNGDLVVKTGSTLSPGNSVGDLTVYGNAIIETGATGLFEFSAFNEDPALQSFDRLIIADNGSFVIDPNSIIKLYFEGNDADLWAADDAEYKLVSDDNFVADITDMSYLLGNYNTLFGLEGRTDGLYLIGLGSGPIPPEPGSGVPEPSTWALLILGVAGLMYWRKTK